MNETPDEGAFPLKWDDEVVDRLTISVAPIGEYGLPLNRRSITTTLPGRENREEFIEKLTQRFRETLELIVKGAP